MNKPLKEGDRTLPVPTLGIMTLYTQNRNIVGEELRYFKKLVIRGKKLGVEAYVFTPEDVRHASQTVHAYVYEPARNKWIRKWLPFPSLIYDRCRYQATKKFQQFKQFRAKYNEKLIFLNRPLANKWAIHQVLSRSSRIRSHLPQTERYSAAALLRTLQNRKLLYVKPINGTGGRGIIRIEKTNDGTAYVQGRDRSRRILPGRRLPLQQLPALLKRWGVDDTYLIQQGIQLKLADGRVHDYRLLIQKNSEGNWEVTGCAGRIGAAHSITSNLHGGGKAVSMNEVLRKMFRSEDKVEAIRQKVYRLSHTIADYLEEQYGKLCELGLDIAVDRDEQVWLLEINPKPAREVFSKIGETETYRTALSRPMEYALWLYKQKYGNK